MATKGLGKGLGGRKALGKGLGALLPNQGVVGTRVSEIPIAKIRANTYQPRTSFREEAIKDLARSIKEKGIIQPVLVQKRDDRYELIAGERRYRACMSLNMETIPAIIKNVSDEESLELALIENIQREELNPLEEARAFRLLMDDFGLTQEKVAKKVGKERSTVANMLRLLKLPEEIQRDIEEGSLTMGHARALLACGTETEMMEMRKQILSYGLNVRDVESRTKKKKSGAKGAAEKKPAYIRSAEEKLKKALSTKVTIKPNKKGGGMVTIEYYSEEDLDRILDNF